MTAGATLASNVTLQEEMHRMESRQTQMQKEQDEAAATRVMSALAGLQVPQLEALLEKAQSELTESEARCAALKVLRPPSCLIVRVKLFWS